MLNKRQFVHRCAGCAFGFSATALFARDGVEVGKTSGFTKLVPAAQVEGSANQQYAQLLKQAKDKNALAPDDHPEVIRLRAISQKSNRALAEQERGRSALDERGGTRARNDQRVPAAPR